jgi:hypothetical protein
MVLATSMISSNPKMPNRGCQGRKPVGSEFWSGESGEGGFKLISVRHGIRIKQEFTQSGSLWPIFEIGRQASTIVVSSLAMSTNQRTSYRCPTADGQPAILRVGRRDVIVSLLDQSAGGFAVSGDESIRLAPGQVLSLRTGMGWCEVEVVTLERWDGELRIGMRRLCDHPDPRLVQAVEANSLPPLFQWSEEDRPRTVIAQFLAGMLLVAPAFWLIIGVSAWSPRLEAQWYKLLRWKMVRQEPNDADPRPSSTLFPREPAAR